MTTNGTLANRDKPKRRGKKITPLQRQEAVESIAGFRVLARQILNSQSQGHSESIKTRLFINAINAIERGLANNERWAVREALALTIGNVKTFVEDGVIPGDDEAGFTMIIEETHTQTIKGPVTGLAPILPLDSPARPVQLNQNDPASPHAGI